MTGRFYSGHWGNANAEGMAGALPCAFQWTATATWPGSRRCCSLRHLAALARRPGAVLRYAAPKTMLCEAVFLLVLFYLLS